MLNFLKILSIVVFTIHAEKSFSQNITKKDTTSWYKLSFDCKSMYTNTDSYDAIECISISKPSKNRVVASIFHRIEDTIPYLSLFISQPLYFYTDSLIILFFDNDTLILHNTIIGQSFPPDGKVYYAFHLIIDKRIEILLKNKEISKIILWKALLRRDVVNSKKQRFISIRIKDKLIISKMLNCFTEKAKK